MTYVLTDKGELQAEWATLEKAPKDSGKMYTTKSVTKKAPRPKPISDADLDLLIGTHVYSYIEKPSSLPIHTQQLLSALLELKDRRLQKAS